MGVWQAPRAQELSTNHTNHTNGLTRWSWLD